LARSIPTILRPDSAAGDPFRLFSSAHANINASFCNDLAAVLAETGYRPVILARRATA